MLPVGLCLNCWSAKRGVHLMRAIMGGSGPGVGGSSLVIGSIPIGAGTMVLRCFLLFLDGWSVSLRCIFLMSIGHLQV